MNCALICPNLESFFEKKRELGYFNFLGIVPFKSIKDNITSTKLTKSEYKSVIFIDYQIGDNECISVCHYLSIFSLFIQVDSSNLLQAASEMLRVIKLDKRFRFFVVCDKIATWMRLYELVDYSTNICACPILSEAPEIAQIWGITQITFAILTEAQFNEDGTIKKQWLPLLHYFHKRGVVFTFLLTTFNSKPFSSSILHEFKDIEQTPAEFGVKPLDIVIPEREVICECLKSMLKGKEGNVLVVSNHSIDFVDACLECGAKHVTILNSNKLECGKIKAITDEAFPEKCSVFSSKNEIAKDLSKFDFVFTDYFLDFASFPELAKSFAPNTEIIPHSMKSTIVPVISHLDAYMKQNDFTDAISCINPSLVMALSSPEELFNFSATSESNQSRTINFKSLVSGMVNGFLCQSMIYITKEETNHTSRFYYIPLSHHVSVRAGDTITIRIDRMSNGSRSYIQWCLLAPQVTPIQNVNGQASSFNFEL